MDTLEADVFSLLGSFLPFQCFLGVGCQSADREGPHKHAVVPAVGEHVKVGFEMVAWMLGQRRILRPVFLCFSLYDDSVFFLFEGS